MKLINIFQSFVVLAITFVVFLVTAEIFLRVSKIMIPSPRIYDPIFTYDYLPNKEILYNIEDHFINRLNAYGLNDKDYKPTEKKGIRIAIYGDSYTEALQVAKNKNFHAIAEENLNGKYNLEIINFGRSGFGAGDEWLFYKKTAPLWQPDIVIVCMSHNDFTDIEDEIVGPYFYVDKNDNLLWRPSEFTIFLERTSVLGILKNNSALVSLLTSVVGKKAVEHYTNQNEPGLKIQAVNQSSYIDTHLTEKILNVFRSDLAKNHTQIGIVLIPHRFPENQYRFIKKWCAEKNVPLLDSLASGTPPDNIFLWKVKNKEVEGHLNTLGHKWFSSLFQDWVEKVFLNTERREFASE